MSDQPQKLVFPEDIASAQRRAHSVAHMKIAELEGEDGWRLRKADQEGGAFKHRLLRTIKWHRNRSNEIDDQLAEMIDVDALYEFDAAAVWGEPDLAPEPLRLAKQDFDALVIDTLGLAKYGDITGAMEAASGGNLGGAWAYYRAAAEVGFDRAVALLSLLVSENVMTTENLDAIQAAWPTDEVTL